jgi:two-component system KDP operon response regulator KdpE
MRVALRHVKQQGKVQNDKVVQIGNISVDLVRRQVRVDTTDVHLTPIEYKLLTTLIRYRGRVVTHRQLLEAAWGKKYATETHYLRVYMGQLRHKIEAESARPRYLITEPGIGYRLQDEN